MTREEAIAELTVHLEHWKHLKEQMLLPCKECENTIKALDMAIESLQDDWIPCSERLPEDCEFVMVSLGNGYNDIAVDHRTRGGDNAQYWYDWEGYVTAWKPLPTPYKGGSEDEMSRQ